MKAEATLAALTLLAGTPLYAEVQTRQFPSAGEAVELLRQCGFSETEVLYDEELQDDVLTLSGVVTSTDEQVSCAAKISIETSYQIVVPEGLQESYWSAYMPLLEAEGRKIARDWLDEHGLLNRVPQYDAATMADVAYAQTLENFCGPKANGALSSEYGPHALSPDWALNRRNSDIEEAGNATMCLTSASAVSGFKIYLIGNAKAREP